MAILVDDVAGVAYKANGGEIGDSPCPSEGPAQSAGLGLGLGGFVGISSAECDPASRGEPHGGGRPRG